MMAVLAQPEKCCLREEKCRKVFGIENSMSMVAEPPQLEKCYLELWKTD